VKIPTIGESLFTPSLCPSSASFAPALFSSLYPYFLCYLSTPQIPFALFCSFFFFYISFRSLLLFYTLFALFLLPSCSFSLPFSLSSSYISLLNPFKFAFPSFLLFSNSFPPLGSLCSFPAIFLFPFSHSFPVPPFLLLHCSFPAIFLFPFSHSFPVPPFLFLHYSFPAPFYSLLVRFAHFLLFLCFALAPRELLITPLLLFYCPFTLPFSSLNTPSSSLAVLFEAALHPSPIESGNNKL